MSEAIFFGVIGIDQQNYAVPLTDILAIESNQTRKSVDGQTIIRFQEQDVILSEFSSKNIDYKFRDLCIVIDHDQTLTALQIDSFDTRQLDADKIKKLPEVMIHEDSVIRDVFFDEDSNELLLILTKQDLMFYLYTKSHV